MAEMDKTSENGRWGFTRPGRRDSRTFKHTVSPLGENMDETPIYSPSRTVNGATPQRRGQISVDDEVQGDGRASQSYSAREQRRS